MSPHTLHALQRLGHLADRLHRRVVDAVGPAVRIVLGESVTHQSTVNRVRMECTAWVTVTRS